MKTHKPKGYWRDIANLERELRKFMRPHRLRRMIPRQTCSRRVEGIWLALSVNTAAIGPSPNA
jgi:hypothetical protein